MFKNSKFSTRPLYLQVRDALVQKIVTGEWKPGAALPNEFALAQDLGVSSGTVGKALDQMSEERIVVRRQGRGTFVADQSASEMAIRFSRIFSPDGLTVEGRIVKKSTSIEPATSEECDRLHLARGQRVIRLERIHLFRDKPFLIENCHLPEHMFRKTPDPIWAYRIYILAQDNKIFLKSAMERLRPRMPTQDEAGELGIDPTQPVLELDRTVIDMNGRPVEWRIGCCALGELSYYAEMT